jgi:hypothetical protein
MLSVKVHGLWLFLLVTTAANAQEAPVEWLPDPVATVVHPRENTSLSAWEPYKGSTTPPSQAQYLDDPVLHGAIDIHAHFGPDTYKRQWDAFEIARRAQQRGMRGIVLKSHWTATADLAELAGRYAAPDMAVWGGLVLNATVGGINPEAVRAFAETAGSRARIVWMPTHDSEHEVRFLKQARPYVRVSRDGVLLPQVLEILDMLARYDLTLATGHVTPSEMLQIIAEARARGVKRIIITHPGLSDRFGNPTLDQVQQGVEKGAFVEVVASELFRDGRADAIAMLRALGPENCILSTDSGIVGTPSHTDAIVMAATILRKAGFTEAELDLMFKVNPAKALGMSGSEAIAASLAEPRLRPSG